MKLKSILAAGTAVALLLGLLVLPARSTTVPAQQEVTQVINALGIMVGDDQGNMQLDRTVTRAEFITMAVKASPNGDQVGESSTSPYPDVPYTHWAAGFVEAGVAAGLITGYSNGTFRPSNQITLAEGVTIVLQLLGYGSEDFSGAYPTPQMALYHSLKLDRGLNAQSSSTVLSRHDAMYLFYNLLSTNDKSGTPYINSLGYSLNAAGEVDLVALINAVMDGPMIASGDWQSNIPFSLSGATVTRDGSPSSASQIQENDVIYWCQSMRTLWVYSDKVVGTIQDITPNTAAPTAVTIGGHSYELDSASAVYALSDLGSYDIGDTVSLLLGRQGKVAAVTAPIETTSERCGVVTKVTRESYSDGYHSSYTADTITLLATDGQSYQYECTSYTYDVGDLVGVNIAADGTVSLKRLSPTRLSGKVNSEGTKIGSTPLADGVEILDVYEGSGTRIFPSRLAGITLNKDMVLYYTLNGSGEIDRLILEDVTGDNYHYGILTDMVEIPTGTLTTYYTYVYDVGGTTYTLANSTTGFPVSTGGIMLKGDLNNPDKMYRLTKLEADRISGNSLIAGNRSYTMADDVVIYEYRNGSYYLSSAQRVTEKGLSLTGWYDKAESSGGRIRIVVAR
jgi:hypothetical protein